MRNGESDIGRRGYERRQSGKEELKENGVTLKGIEAAHAKKGMR